MSESRRVRPEPGASLYTQAPGDPAAVVATDRRFGAVGDGEADDSAAVQAAIDSLQPPMDKASARRAVSRQGLPCGIVLLPEGTYRLSRTIHVWWGVRLIGFGRRRPKLLLAEAAPGFADGEGAPMLHFCGPRPMPGDQPPDANNATFFSGLSNVDIRIERGNPAAVGMRCNFAQHCSIDHADFHLADARAGIAQAGNEIQNCRFFGGEHALTTGRTSAGWQLLVCDCAFQGQRTSCIETRQAGLTVVRGVFRDAPRGVVVPPGADEKLYLKDCLLENLTAGIETDCADDPVFQVNAENVVCVGTPKFHLVRGGESLGCDADAYTVRRLSAGLHVTAALSEGCDERTETIFEHESHSPSEAGRPQAPPAEPDMPVPPPMDSWVNVRDFGAAGDGESDDTAALREALRHRAVYFPQGRYRVTDCLEPPPETALIGLHPATTQIVLQDGTAGFGDADTPRAMLETPSGGANLVTGLGTNPGLNAGAVAVRWRAGDGSGMDDVFFDWVRVRCRRKGLDAGVSLEVVGGGTFRNVWSANYHAPCGLYVSGDGPGRVYLMSVEHHRDAEVVLRGASGWRFYALQTEENLGSEAATAVVMDRCRDVLFANLFLYRVMGLSRRHPCGMRIADCRDLRVRGLHVFSLGRFPFESAACDARTGRRLTRREAAWVDL